MTDTIGPELHTAEARLSGRTIDLNPEPTPCEHRGRFGVDDSLGAVINDERGELASRELRIQVRCMDCGTPMRIDLDRIRRPREGQEHGVVLVLEPME